VILEEEIDEFLEHGIKLHRAGSILEAKEYYQKVLNIHKLSIENLQQIEPKFKDEIERLEGVEQNIIELAIKEFYKGKEAKSIASSIVMISNGIKHEYVRKAETLFAYEVDYTGAAADTQQAIKLILKGIK